MPLTLNGRTSSLVVNSRPPLPCRQVLIRMVVPVLLSLTKISLVGFLYTTNSPSAYRTGNCSFLGFSGNCVCAIRISNFYCIISVIFCQFLKEKYQELFQWGDCQTNSEKNANNSLEFCTLKPYYGRIIFRGAYWLKAINKLSLDSSLKKLATEFWVAIFLEMKTAIFVFGGPKLPLKPNHPERIRLTDFG